MAIFPPLSLGEVPVRAVGSVRFQFSVFRFLFVSDSERIRTAIVRTGILNSIH